MDNRQSIAYRQTTRIQSESRLNSSELHSNSKESIAWSAEEWFALVSAKSCTVAIWARPRRLNKPFTVALVVDWRWLVLIRRYSKIKTGGIPAQASWRAEVGMLITRGSAFIQRQSIEGSILNCHNSSRSDYFHFLHRSQYYQQWVDRPHSVPILIHTSGIVNLTAKLDWQQNSES